MNLNKRVASVVSTTIASALALLSGCAAPGPAGAVLPLEGGRYQHSITGFDPEQALKALAADAGRTCSKDPQKKLMPWETAPAGRFVVLSQSMKDKDGKEIKSANKNLDAGIAVGLRYFGLDAKDTVQSTTVFRCE